MKLHIFKSGRITAWKNLIIRGASCGERITLPVIFYLIEHKGQKFLFDTGLYLPDYEQEENADYIISVTEKELAINQLTAIGIKPEDIAGMILSHWHRDHSGGIGDFPEVPCYVRKEELKEKRWFAKCDTASWIYPEGKYDLCCDGRIVLIPTPGHTDGHQSLLLTMDDGKKILLAADAAYTQETVGDELKKLADKVIAGHDCNFIYKENVLCMQ